MKHTLGVTLTLLLLFLTAQAIGIITVSRYIDIKATSSTGVTTIYKEKYLISPPEVPESTSWAYIAFAILVGTGLALLIVKFNKVGLWKTWFFLSVFLTLTLGFFPYVDFFLGKFVPPTLATLILAFVFASWKLFWPNVVVYNITEVFVYSGIAALLVPILNLVSIIVLLLIVSLYDFWAVYRTKHMVKLAKFQSKSNLFAGLLVPYKEKPHRANDTAEGRAIGMARSAILGGGDIAFPLLFSGVVLKLTGSFLDAFIISFSAGACLFTLFMFARKDRYYPAMPVLTFGCLLGYALVLFI